MQFSPPNKQRKRATPAQVTSFSSKKPSNGRTKVTRAGHHRIQFQFTTCSFPCPPGSTSQNGKKSGKVWRPPFHSALSIIHSAAAGKSSSASARKVSPAWWTTASKYQPSSRVNFPDATPPENSTHTTSWEHFRSQKMLSLARSFMRGTWKLRVQCLILIIKKLCN